MHVLFFNKLTIFYSVYLLCWIRELTFFFIFVGWLPNTSFGQLINMVKSNTGSSKLQRKRNYLTLWSSVPRLILPLKKCCQIAMFPCVRRRTSKIKSSAKWFIFQKMKTLEKHWVHAIQRDVGPYFSIPHGTRVCSWHFKPEDLRGTPQKTNLKPGVVPSIFEWKWSSPHQRRPTTPRSEPLRVQYWAFWEYLWRYSHTRTSLES